MLAPQDLSHVLEMDGVVAEQNWMSLYFLKGKLADGLPSYQPFHHEGFRGGGGQVVDSPDRKPGLDLVELSEFKKKFIFTDIRGYPEIRLCLETVRIELDLEVLDTPTRNSEMPVIDDQLEIYL
jgi:hypothetical protein